MGYSSELSVVYSGTVYSQNSTQLTIANATNTPLIQSFTVTMPSSTRKFTFVLTLYLVSNGSAYAMQRGSLSFNCNAGDISLVTITALSY